VSPLRQLLLQLAAMIVLLAGAFLCVLGASTGRWPLLFAGAPVVAAALSLLGYIVVRRNRG
jgi:hypothetical protein